MRDLTREAQFQTLLARNHILFTIKNIGGWGFLAGFLALAPLRLLTSVLRGDRVTARGLLAAAPRVGSAVRARLRSDRRAALTSRAIAGAASRALSDPSSAPLAKMPAATADRTRRRPAISG